MTLKCYSKPNRTTPRRFTPCDAARIAREAAKSNNLENVQVLACVAKGLGFTYISIRQDMPVVMSGVNISKTPALVVTLLTLLAKLIRDPGTRRRVEDIIRRVGDDPNNPSGDCLEYPVDQFIGSECKCKG
jgi:hypothetical protein